MSEDDDIVTKFVNHAKSIKGNFVNGEFVNNFTKAEIEFLIKDIDDFNREHAKMSDTVKVKKSDVTYFKINNGEEFPYKLGHTLRSVTLYGCTIIEIDGDELTLQLQTEKGDV